MGSSPETLFARLITGIFYPLKPGRVGRAHVEKFCVSWVPRATWEDVNRLYYCINMYQHHLHQHTFLPPIGILRKCVSTGLTSPISHFPNLFNIVRENPAPVTCRYPTNLSCLLCFFCKNPVMQKLRPTIRVEAKDLCTTPTFVFPLHQNGRVELLRQIFVSAVLQSAFEDAT